MTKLDSSFANSETRKTPSGREVQATGKGQPGIPSTKVSPVKITTVLKQAKSFLLVTHKEPDADGIGSMLGLGKSLLNAKKDVILLTEEPLSAPFDLLKGSGGIVQNLDAKRHFDAVVALDCGEIRRLGGLRGFPSVPKPLIINIDHHETNDLFGDLNYVDAGSSSTGELVYEVIKVAGFPMDFDVAENIFAAIQADTGSFRYDNTTPASLKIAAEIMAYGVSPWELSRKLIDGYSVARLKLLEMALSTIEFHHGGKIGMMILSLELFERARANRLDSERFVDYPRFVSGVEIAILIRERGESDYKFSLRSNGKVNVAQLASRFGGGGHARAAGFECRGSIGILKEDFLKEAGRFLDGISN